MMPLKPQVLASAITWEDRAIARDDVGGDAVEVLAVGRPADGAVVGDAAEAGVDGDAVVAGFAAQGFELVHQAADVFSDHGFAHFAAAKAGAIVGVELAPVEMRGGAVCALQAVEHRLGRRATNTDCHPGMPSEPPAHYRFSFC